MIHDYDTVDAVTGAQLPPHLMTLTDDNRNLRYASKDGLMEPSDGHIAGWFKADSSATSFTIGKLPANAVVQRVEVFLHTALNANNITLAVGYSGSTGAYMAATHFTTTMDTTGFKTVTTVKAHNTANRTVIGTLGSAPSAGKILVIVHYAKVPAVPA